MFQKIYKYNAPRYVHTHFSQHEFIKVIERSIFSFRLNGQFTGVSLVLQMSMSTRRSRSLEVALEVIKIAQMQLPSTTVQPQLNSNDQFPTQLSSSK